METIKLDISKTGIAVSAEMQAKAQAANALLESGKGAGNDFLGWVHLPSSISAAEIEAIEKQAAKLREKAEVIICIGIGGSYLGRQGRARSHERPVQVPAQGADSSRGALRWPEYFGRLHLRTARSREGALDRHHRDFEIGHDDRTGHRLPPDKGRDRKALRQEGGCANGSWRSPTRRAAL